MKTQGERQENGSAKVGIGAEIQAARWQAQLAQLWRRLARPGAAVAGVGADPQELGLPDYHILSCLQSNPCKRSSL